MEVLTGVGFFSLSVYFNAERTSERERELESKNTFLSTAFYSGLVDCSCVFFQPQRFKQVN